MRISRLRLRLVTVRRHPEICTCCKREIRLGERLLKLEWGYVPAVSPAQAADTEVLPNGAFYSREVHICLTCGPKGVRNPKLQDKAAELTERGIGLGRDKALLERIRREGEAAELAYRVRQAKRVARLVKV